MPYRYFLTFSMFMLNACQNPFDSLSDTNEVQNPTSKEVWLLLKDEKKIDRYYLEGEKVFWEAKVSYEVEGANLNAFVVHSAFPNYAKDQNQAYYFGYPLQVDYQSFEVINEDHHKDNNGVYLGGHQLPNADAATFEILDRGEDFFNFYSKDKNQVYYEWEVIEGADPKTFEVLGNGYSKDADSVFERYYHIPGADPHSFEPISTRQAYYKDKNHVYWRADVLEGADPESFEILKKDEYYAVDADSVYYYAKKLEGADPKTFKTLEAGYSKDSHRVFYEEKKVEGADPDSFEVTKMGINFYGKDKNGEYLYENKVK